MRDLVIKEKIEFKLVQEFAFGQAAEEHGLIDINVPVH